jgi:flagellar L-ring protein precursor FlgH
MIPRFLMLLWVGVAAATLMSCSSLNTLMGNDEKPAVAEAKPEIKIDGQPLVKFSEDPNHAPVTAREFHHMTKQKLEEESQLQAGAGSMWVMEGQGAYLFAQNRARREGDLLNIKIEGQAQKEVETKVSVIRKLLKQLEDEERKAKELQAQQIAAANAAAAAAAAANEDPSKPGGAPRAPAAAAPAPTPAPVAEDKKEKDEEVKIESVPTRIVERLPDGNYKVKGQSPFMIGKKEYKVIVMGTVRPEDFNDDGTSSGKLLDPQFDVVSLRRKE